MHYRFLYFFGKSEKVVNFKLFLVKSFYSSYFVTTIKFKR